MSLAGGSRKRPVRYSEGALSELTRAAMRAQKQGDVLAAAELYELAVQRDERDLDAWVNLGAANVSLGRAKRAKSALRTAIELAASDARVQRDVGIGLAMVGEHHAALRALERSVALDPSAAGARLHLVRVALDAGEEARARSHARALAQAWPDEPAAQLELSRASFDDRDLVPALSALERAVSLAPDDERLAYLLEAVEVVAGTREPTHASLAYVKNQRTPRTRFFAHRRAALLHALCHAPARGPVVELGVRHGVSARWLASARTGRVIGFDSFAGLPAPFAGRGPGLFSTAGELPELPTNVSLRVGLFEQTLPSFVHTERAPLALIHVDCDLYESAREALFALGELVRPGCVIAFDEYLGPDGFGAGEHRALHEAARKFGWAHELLLASPFTGQVAVAITDTR